MDALERLMRGLSAGGSTPDKVLASFDLDGIAQYVKEHDVRNVIMMLGAGASVAAGIPDFRTPGTGLYDNLSKYDLPFPEAIFTLDYFRKRPQAFFTLAKELWPGSYMPTPAHYFGKVLHDEGRLLRCYTQNIDGLETVAGLPQEKVFAAHGGFAEAHCVDCGKAFTKDFVKGHVMDQTVPECACGGYVKPDIVFFGESLPENFEEMLQSDFPKCDLLIVAGTSLSVMPFASLVTMPDASVPRLLVNNERVGGSLGMVFEGDKQYRDVYVGGNLQDALQLLADKMGLAEPLADAVEAAKRHFSKDAAPEPAAEAEGKPDKPADATS